MGSKAQTVCYIGGGGLIRFPNLSKTEEGNRSRNHRTGGGEHINLSCTVPMIKIPFTVLLTTDIVQG